MQFTQAQCESVAREFLGEYVDVSQYQEEIARDELYDGYLITFTKYLNGYPTTDMAQVCVLDNGKIGAYTSCMFGMVPSASNITFDYDKAVQAVYQKLDTIYADAKAKYESVVYEPEFKYTVLEDGELGLFCSVKISTKKENSGGLTTASGGVVAFIIEMRDGGHE